MSHAENAALPKHSATPVNWCPIPAYTRYPHHTWIYVVCPRSVTPSNPIPYRSNFQESVGDINSKTKPDGYRDTVVSRHPHLTYGHLHMFRICRGACVDQKNKVRAHMILPRLSLLVVSISEPKHDQHTHHSCMRITALAPVLPTAKYKRKQPSSKPLRSIQRRGRSLNVPKQSSTP